jgi:hypothetical protein
MKIKSIITETSYPRGGYQPRFNRNFYDPGNHNIVGKMFDPNWAVWEYSPGYNIAEKAFDDIPKDEITRKMVRILLNELYNDASTQMVKLGRDYVTVPMLIQAFGDVLRYVPRDKILKADLRKIDELIANGINKIGMSFNGYSGYAGDENEANSWEDVGKIVKYLKEYFPKSFENWLAGDSEAFEVIDDSHTEWSPEMIRWHVYALKNGRGETPADYLSWIPKHLITPDFIDHIFSLYKDDRPSDMARDLSWLSPTDEFQDVDPKSVARFIEHMDNLSPELKDIAEWTDGKRHDFIQHLGAPVRSREERDALKRKEREEWERRVAAHRAEREREEAEKKAAEEQSKEDAIRRADPKEIDDKIRQNPSWLLDIPKDMRTLDRWVLAASLYPFIVSCVTDPALKEKIKAELEKTGEGELQRIKQLGGK